MEREQAAAAQGERVAETKGEQARTFAGPAPASAQPRSWSAAQVALLQRTAGNAAVARVLGAERAPERGPAPSGPARIQRQLRFQSQWLGPAGKGTYAVIKQKLTAYEQERKADPRHSYLLGMLTDIATWKQKHGAGASTEDRQRALLLDNLAFQIQHELPEAEAHAQYVRDMFLGKFRYTSFESQGQVGVTDLVISGVADPARAEYGEGATAIEEARKYGLTEAELLALKVYSVGDYQIINPSLAFTAAQTLAGKASARQWLTGNLPDVAGLIKDPATGQVLKRPDRPDPNAPPAFQQAAKQAYKQKKQQFKGAVQAFLGQTPLSAVYAEAQRHAPLVISGLQKLPDYDSASKGPTFRGVRHEWKKFRAEYTPVGAIIQSPAFVSTSKSKDRAEKFARPTNTKDDRIGILLICKLRRGRDISSLSAHGKEHEVLLMPDAKLRVDSDPRLAVNRGYEWEIDVTEV